MKIPQTQQDKLFNFGEETPTTRAEELAQKNWWKWFPGHSSSEGETLLEYPTQSCGDQSFLGGELKEEKAFGGGRRASKGSSTRRLDGGGEEMPAIRSRCSALLQRTCAAQQ